MEISDCGTILRKVTDTDIKNGTFNIPKDITNIGFMAFASCRHLTELTIPEGVSHIDAVGIAGCTSLTNLTLREGLIGIYAEAFRECTSLTNLTLPKGVSYILDDAFRGCTSLTNLTLREGLASIGNGTFRDCTSLKNLTLPEGVISIGDGAFIGCESLECISVNTDNDEEINRIRLLVPEEHRNKVIKSSFIKQAKECQIKALEELYRNPMISPIFGIENCIFQKLPDDMHYEINQFVGEDNFYYQQAKKEMFELQYPRTIEELESYEIKALKISKAYSKLAIAHKQERDNQSVSKSGFGLFQSPTSGEEKKTDDSKCTEAAITRQGQCLIL